MHMCVIVYTYMFGRVNELSTRVHPENYPIGQIVNFGNDFTIAEYEGVHKFSTSSIAPNNEIDHLS